jgi:hypothetical protein
MSDVSNNNWYNLNSTRKYPLDDGCSGINDDGKIFPATIIADINLRLSKPVGVGVMLSSIIVNSSVVSVTFLAINHPIIPSLYDPAPPPPSFSPLCAVTLTKPVTPGVPYVVSPFVDGVAGWIVFGDGISKNHTSKFSTPTQSALNPKTCRYYNTFPVTSVGKKNSTTALSGLVSLVAGKDISITKGTRLINGMSKQAIIVSLKEDSQQTVLNTYKGPCAGRPESGTCAQTGLEFINTVNPDCNGNINIDFQYPFRVAIYETESEGLAIDYPIGLIDACNRDDLLPNAEGKLPAQYTDQCNPSSEGNLDGDVGNEGAILPPPITISSTTLSCTALPACVSFDHNPINDWQVIKGSFSLSPLDSPIEICADVTYSMSSLSLSSSSSSSYPYAVYADRAYSSTSLSDRNIALWYNCGYDSTEDIKLKTDLMLLDSGTSSNGGIVLNYRTNTYGTVDEYFFVDINKAKSSLAISRFNGVASVELTSAIGLGISSNTWYRLEVDVEPAAVVNKVRITATLYSVPGLVTLSSIVLETALYRPSTGKVGLITNRARSLFSYFSMESI